MTHIVRNLLCLTAIASGAATFTACGDDDFEGSISGVAMVVTADAANEQRVMQVHNGDNVKFTIGAIAGQRCDLNIVHISGVSYAPEVYYCIDGQRVGMSRDENTFFAVPYEVKGLSAGQHTLSVDIPKMYHNIDYTVNVQSSTFEVVE